MYSYSLRIACLFVVLSYQVDAFAVNTTENITLYGIHLPKTEGAVPAVPHSHPWMIDIQTTRGLTHQCGSALVRICRNCNQSDIVLTAAHCVVNLIRDLHLPSKQRKDSSELRVVAGKHWQNGSNEGEISVNVSSIHVHPGWDPLGPSGMRHDIAILHTIKPIRFVEGKIQPIDLPYWNETLSNRSRCKVAGWGSTHHGESVATELYEINATIAEEKECLGDHADVRHFYDREWMVCTASDSGGPTTCSGDSGGVLTCEKNADRRIGYGVVSFGGDKCGGDYKNSVFTAVQPHLLWIGVTAYELTRVKNDRYLCDIDILPCNR